MMKHKQNKALESSKALLLRSHIFYSNVL